MAKKNKKVSAGENESFSVNINVEARPDTPFYYVNCMSVTHSAFDFTIGATRVPLPLSPEQMASAKKKEPIVLEPTVQLVTAPWVIKHLIEALTEQVNKYEEQFGKITTQIPGSKNDG